MANINGSHTLSEKIGIDRLVKKFNGDVIFECGTGGVAHMNL